LTFTTIPGAGATDATSFVGTDGVDILVTFNTLTAFVGAQGSQTASPPAIFPAKSTGKSKVELAMTPSSSKPT
jgi:hypothetical protein